MDINALLNLQPTGNRPGGDLARGQDGGFQGTLEAALAKNAASATATPGLTLLAGATTPLASDPAMAAATARATATATPLPAAAPLNLLAGDAAALLSPGRAGGEASAASDEARSPIQESSERDSPAPEGLVVLASAPTVPVASTPGDTPDTTLASQRGNAAIDRAALATPQQAPVEADAEQHAASTNSAANRPAPLTAGDAPTTAPPAAAVLEAERTSGRATAVAEPAPPTASPVQSAAANPVSTTTSPAPAILQTPVASSGWGQELGQQMVNLTQRGDQHMELHLNPRDLGPLSVSLKLDDNGAQAHFLSNHAAVRSAVEQAIPQLREALAQQGIALGEAMVGDQPQQQFNGQSGDGQRDGTPATALTDGVDDTAATGAQPARTVVLPTSGVDLYA